MITMRLNKVKASVAFIVLAVMVAAGTAYGDQIGNTSLSGSTSEDAENIILYDANGVSPATDGTLDSVVFVYYLSSTAHHARIGLLSSSDQLVDSTAEVYLTCGAYACFDTVQLPFVNGASISASGEYSIAVRQESVVGFGNTGSGSTSGANDTIHRGFVTYSSAWPDPVIADFAVFDPRDRILRGYIVYTPSGPAAPGEAGRRRRILIGGGL